MDNIAKHRREVAAWHLTILIEVSKRRRGLMGKYAWGRFDETFQPDVQLLHKRSEAPRWGSKTVLADFPASWPLESGYIPCLGFLWRGKANRKKTADSHTQSQKQRKGVYNGHRMKMTFTEVEWHRKSKLNKPSTRNKTWRKETSTENEIWRNASSFY